MTIKVRDDEVRPVAMKLLGGPLDEKLLLYLIDFDFTGAIIIPLFEANKIPTGVAAMYKQLLGVDEDNNILMEFVKLVEAPQAVVFEDPEELDQEVLL